MLAERLLKQHGENTNDALVEAFRLLTSRRPTDAELDVVRSLYDQQFVAYANNVDQATQYLNTGDKPFDAALDLPRLAALAVVTNTLLSFDECVMER